MKNLRTFNEYSILLEKLTKKEKLSDEEKVKAMTEFVIENIPNDKDSDKEWIKSFEKINKETYKYGNGKDYSHFTFSGYEDFFNKNKNLFNKLDNYFTKVHSIIRKKASESDEFKETMEYMVKINKKMFTYKDSIEAYNKTLDHYDKRENKLSDRLLAWSGFWSLIGTKNGEIEGVYLSDTADREYYYDAIEKITKLSQKDLSDMYEEYSFDYEPDYDNEFIAIHKFDKKRKDLRDLVLSMKKLNFEDVQIPSEYTYNKNNFFLIYFNDYKNKIIYMVSKDENKLLIPGVRDWEDNHGSEFKNYLSKYNKDLNWLNDIIKKIK